MWKKLLKNYMYIFYIGLYFLIAWVMLGGDTKAFFVTFITYTLSILLALSPLGEALLRFIQQIRPLRTQEEKEYLLPIFNEVYESAKEQNPNLNGDIELYIDDKMYINAFAVGRKTVAVSMGAIQTFSVNSRALFPMNWGTSVTEIQKHCY